MDSNFHFGPARNGEQTVYGERVVVHCWGGNGRTGHVLSAWLVAARGLSPLEAIEAVEATGRLPREAILASNAVLEELIALLTSCRPDTR
jgi:protein-tyrosine phosphatase